MADIEFEGLAELVVDLAHAAASVAPKAARVVGKGALNVKKAMQADAEKSKHFKIAKDIGYDHYTLGADGLEAQVGPQKRGAGNLAVIAYFGGAHGGGGSIRDPKEALAEEAPAFEKHLWALIDEVLP